MEKWILRTMLTAVVLTGVAAVVASRGDIRRYLRIRKM